MFARPGLCGMGIGRLGLVAASRNAFNPLSLFAAGEPGAWYDPSDLSTLFQDSAGTVPVTAVEQPVGLILDKARPIVTNGAERMNVLPSEAANWAGGNNTVVGNKIIPNTNPNWSQHASVYNYEIDEKYNEPINEMIPYYMNYGTDSPVFSHQPALFLEETIKSLNSGLLRSELIKFLKQRGITAK